MTYRVKIGVRAKRDIAAIVVWIADSNEFAARQWYGQVRAAVQTLEKFPERCPFAPENGLVSREIRHLLCGKRGCRYRILFTIKEKTVHVLHIRHGAREWLGSEEIELP